MINPRLEHIELSNFRSIRGCVSIPLGADIILVHGSNGTGKTSLLSGLELGLTGKISTLASMSENYAEHLLHEGTVEGTVRLQVSEASSRENSLTQIDLQRRSIEGEPLLSPELAKFFSERSYLAQATLGRLLELYQTSDKRGDSLLTRFVNDLLGLDHLDALIEGLAKSGDIRAVRKLITELGDQERLTASLRSELAALEQKIAACEREAASENSSFTSATSHADAPVDVDHELSGIHGELEWLLPQLTELRKLNQHFNDSDVGVEAENLERADGDRDRAEALWSAWDRQSGAVLRQIKRRAYRALHTPTNMETGSPAENVSALKNLLKKSIAEARAGLTQISAIERQFRHMHAEVSRLSTQRRELASRESDYSDAAGVASLSHALASLIPHIDTDLCPACGRDFQEVSEQPLIERVREAARSLNLLAEQLQVFREQRRELDEQQVQLKRSISTLIPQLPEPQKKSSLESELQVLLDIETALAELDPEISAGTLLWKAAQASANHRASLEASNLRLSAMRERVQEIAAANQYPVTEQVDWPTCTARMEQLLSEKVASLNSRRSFLGALGDSRRTVVRVEAEITRLRVQLRAVRESLEQVENQTDAAKVRIDMAKALMKAAVEVRQSVVAEVFDAKLNDTWRDLFIKLAPGEPFTPKFVVKPRARAKAGAELQVVHRNANRSGPPSALLSAGNLNTAALTLFLSLHLAAEPKLPWLILDDPVQAMDDIHISHFAALLRSFAHDLSRQVVIAVHERSLFDYLALELSPARPGQRLVTVELSRKSVGKTSATVETIEWEPDRAIVG